LDILGFGDLLRRRAEEGKTQRLLDDIYLILLDKRRALNPSLGAQSDMEWPLKMFSDNLVLGCPIKDPPEASELFEFFCALARYQMALIEHGLFIRGGLSMGDLFIDHKLVFGLALIQAYEIEKQEAVNPRIMVSRNFIEHMRNNSAEWGPEIINDFSYSILTEASNCGSTSFINYLYLASRTASLTLHKIKYNVSWHKKLIEEMLKYFEDKPKELSKYIWAAHYHNYFIKSINEYPLDEPAGSEFDNYLIAVESAAFKFQRFSF
jgi:hypothetical protein